MSVDIVSFTQAFGSLDLVIGLVGGVVLILYRDHPNVRVRCPEVLITEIVASSVHAAVVTLTYVDYSTPQCQPAASFVEGLEWFVASIYLGRACLFYMQSKFHFQRQDRLLDRFIDVLSWFVAPGQYFTLKRALEGLRKNKAEDNSLETGSIASNDEAKNDWRNMFHVGFARYILCASCWGVFGFTTSFIETAVPMGADVFAPGISQVECWADYIIWQTSALFFFTGLMSLVFVYAFFGIKDLVGLRHEFVLSFLIIAIAKLFNAFNFVFLFLEETFVSDSIALFLIPFTVLTITLISAFQLHCLPRPLRSSEISATELATSWREVQKLWMSSEKGKKTVELVTQKLYMSEATRFLRDTDNLTTQKATRSRFLKLQKQYIGHTSKDEINISGKLQQQWADLSKKESASAEELLSLIESTRNEVFILIYPSVSKHAPADLSARRSMSRRGSSSAGTEGRLGASGLIPLGGVERR